MTQIDSVNLNTTKRTNRRLISTNVHFHTDRFLISTTFILFSQFSFHQNRWVFMRHECEKVISIFLESHVFAVHALGFSALVDGFTIWIL